MHGRKNVFRSAIFVIGAVIVTGCGDVRSGQQEPGMQGSSGTVITDISETAPEGLSAGQSGEGMAESPGEVSTNGTESGVPGPPEFGLQQMPSEQMELSIPILPATGRELSDFVAEGWELIDSVELDYNEDGVIDYVGVQEAMTDMPEGQKRSGLRILFGIASEGPGQYRLDFQDENLIPTFEEGGPFGDPYEPLTAEGTSFTTSAYGGSAWKGEHTYTYVYRDGNWYLERSEESTWFIGPYTTDWVTDDWGRGVRTRRIQSDDREVMERRLEEQEEREDEEEYDLVYEMRLDEPPTLSQSGKRGWLAPDRVTDWEVREIQFAEGTGITPDGIDIVKPDKVYGFYYDENCVLYTFSNRVQEDRQKYYLAMYRWQDKSLTILTEGDGYAYICDPRYYRDKIYYITEVTGDVAYRSAGDEKDPVREECRIGMRLKRICADGTGEETIFEYMCPGLEEQPLAERPPWMNLRVRDISGGEIVVQVETDGPDPVYRMNVDGSGRRQIGQVPKESEPEINTGSESGAEENPAMERLRQMMPDEELCRAVADAAGIKESDTGEVLSQKLEQCESLILNQEDIRSLEGLGEALPGLRELNIHYDSWDDPQVEDYSPIGELSHLEKLRIAWPVGEGLDFSFLAGMGTVTELDFFACDLKDTLFLSEMPQLKRLSLGYTPVGDLEVLKNMTGLEKLEIYGDRNGDIKNAGTIGRLTDLRELTLQDCGIEDISYLGALIRLRKLDLARNSVIDISSLASLTELERLHLAENRISDIAALQNLTHLYDVGLSGNQIRDFWPLSDKPDLLYLSVSGNPCTDPGPVLTVPYLHFKDRKLPETEEQLETVADWMAKYRPDMEEYECFDYKEADLNGDGLPDAAFVVNGDFMEEEVYSYNNERRLFILLRNRDGSFSEVKHDIRMGDLISGGGRGDPYRGIWMGNGYVLAKSESGSGVGTVTTKIYRYKQGGLEPMWTIVVDDCWDGDTVSVYNGQEPGTWVRYAVALDENSWRMFRVDLANEIYPAVHKALPKMDKYYIHQDKLPTRMDGTEALECFRESRTGAWEREELPYGSWQKENYELLKGVALPEYYYEDGDAYFFYYDLESYGGEYYHVIRNVWDGKYHQDYRIKDSTGEIEG